MGSRGPQDPGHWVQRRLGRGPREGGILSEADPRGQDGGPLAPPMPPGVRREHRRDGVLPSQGDRLEGTAPPTWQLNLGVTASPPSPPSLRPQQKVPDPSLSRAGCNSEPRLWGSLAHMPGAECSPSLPKASGPGSPLRWVGAPEFVPPSGNQGPPQWLVNLECTHQGAAASSAWPACSCDGSWGSGPLGRGA